MVHFPQEVPAETYDPDRILKAFQNVQSNPILDPVIEQLALPQKWHLSPEACLQRLAANLHVRQFRGTSIIQIEFTDPNPDLSVAITSAIAQKYTESTNRQVGGFAGLGNLEPLEPPTPNPKRLPWYSRD